MAASVFVIILEELTRSRDAPHVSGRARIHKAAFYRVIFVSPNGCGPLTTGPSGATGTFSIFSAVVDRSRLRHHALFKGTEYLQIALPLRGV